MELAVIFLQDGRNVLDFKMKPKAPFRNALDAWCQQHRISKAGAEDVSWVPILRSVHVCIFEMMVGLISYQTYLKTAGQRTRNVWKFIVSVFESGARLADKSLPILMHHPGLSINALTPNVIVKIMWRIWSTQLGCSGFHMMWSCKYASVSWLLLEFLYYNMYIYVPSEWFICCFHVLPLFGASNFSGPGGGGLRISRNASGGRKSWSLWLASRLWNAGNRSATATTSARCARAIRLCKAMISWGWWESGRLWKDDESMMQVPKCTWIRCCFEFNRAFTKWRTCIMFVEYTRRCHETRELGQGRQVVNTFPSAGSVFELIPAVPTMQKIHLRPI